jgi:hypothetical protein
MPLRDDRLQQMILQLPPSLRERAEEMASHEHLSLNLFVAIAIAEKLQHLQLQQCLDISEQDELHLTANAKDLALVH